MLRRMLRPSGRIAGGCLRGESRRRCFVAEKTARHAWVWSALGLTAKIGYDRVSVRVTGDLNVLV
jgi:hypothetical protein